MTLKILIIGGSSIVGTKMLRQMLENEKDVEFTYNKNNIPFTGGYKLDITKHDETVELIKKINPDIVFHTSALTSIDVCETNHILADVVNIQGTKNIVEGCKLCGSKIAYVSTSFVFDGKKTQYFEDDLTSPATYYGFTKWRGEEIVKNSGLKHLILRTDALYGWIEKWQRQNSVTRVLDTLNSGKILKEVTDWYNTPTYIPDFVKAAEMLINNNEKGTYHLSGSNFINRYKWSLQVAEVFSLDVNMIEPINSDVLNLPAKRVNINLNNQKLFKKIGMQMKTVKEGLEDMLKCNKP